MMDEDSDVIELTDEVGSSTLPPVEPADELEALGLEMPAFRLPDSAEGGADPGRSGEVPSAAIIARRRTGTHQRVEEGGSPEFDRQSMVKTIQMYTLDREQNGAVAFDGLVLLTDQRLAPDIVILPPRVLVKRWQEGPPRSERGATAEHGVSDEPGDEPLQEPAEAEVPVPVVVDDAPEELPELHAEPIELDSDALEIDEERSTKRPPRRPPAHTPSVAQPVQQPVSRGGHEDSEVRDLVQELLEEQKPKPAERTRKPRPRDIWFQEAFSEEYLRTLPADLDRQTERDVDFITQSLGLKRESRILDLACGFGRHSIEMSQRGYEMVGLDLSMPLLHKALNDSKKRSQSIKFIHGDMRDLSFSEIFDGCFIWQTSFGYFDDRTNLKVIQGVHRALKAGGRFLVDVVNRDYIVGQMPTRTWWEGRNCIFLEEVEFDYNLSVMHAKRSFIYEDGTPPLEQHFYIRLYSLHELRQMLNLSGFTVLEVSGERHHRGYFLGPSSSRLMILAEKKKGKG